MAAQSSIINFKALRWSLALLLLSCLLAGASTFAAIHFTVRIEQAHKRALGTRSETQARLMRVNEDAREIADKIDRYNSLVQGGRIAPERRLEWVEAMRQIKESRRLSGLEYEIGPQRPLDEKMVSSGGYDFLTSPMKLAMPLLHENDLLGFFADLAGRVQAIVSVKRCRIERAPIDRSRRLAPTLTAHCEVDWITLQEKT